MQKQSFLQALTDGSEIRLLRAIRQHWFFSRWQNYLTIPRADYGLLLLLEGGMDYSWECGSLTLQPGDLIFLSKGSHYDVRMYTEFGTVNTLLINFDFPEDPHLPVLPPQLLCSNASARFASSMGNVADSFSAPASYQSKAHFYWLLNDLQLLLTQQNDPYAQIIEQAAALLKLDEPPAMAEVARQCRVSESTLRRLFHQRLQTSPAKYRSEAKLQRACTMLVTTDLTIEEIASSLHYTDAAYFCRCFTSRFGTTPARYRQAHRPVL